MLKGEKERPFALRLLRGVMHTMDTINRTVFGNPFFALREAEVLLRRMHGLQGFDLIRAALAENGGTTINTEGLEHIPRTGGVVIVSTHSTGFFDFLIHGGALVEVRPDLRVVANKETEAFLGSGLIVPVMFNAAAHVTSGEATQAAMIEHVEKGGALIVFGSGHVANRKDGKLFEPVWRKGATRCSIATGCPIIPAAVNSGNSDAYYRTRAIAKFLTGGSEALGERIGTLRYLSEVIVKLGGEFEVRYGSPLPSGTRPQELKEAAQALVPDLY